MKELMIFEGNQVEIITNEKGEPLFEIYSTGMALGHVKFANGKAYPRKDRIDRDIKNAEISTVVQAGQRYLTEEQLYDFMLECKTDKCKPFRKWVTHEVLPSLRKNGVYAVPNDTRGFSLYDQRMEREEKILEGYKQVLGNRKKVTNLYVNVIKRELGVNSAKHKDYINVKECILGYYNVESFEELPKNNIEVLNTIVQICRQYDPGWSQISMFDDEE